MHVVLAGFIGKTLGIIVIILIVIGIIIGALLFGGKKD